jgi:hypothetical protein
LLEQHQKPYDESLEVTADEELQWCFVKNGFLKKDNKFELMYTLDQENRAVIKEALVRKQLSFVTEVSSDSSEIKEIAVEKKTIGCSLFTNHFLTN